MIIWIINDSDKTCKIVADAMKGELPMDNVYSMVFNVIAALSGRKLTGLNVVDHGNSTSACFGKEVVTAANFNTYRWTLKQLRSRFVKSGFAHFRHCQVGKDAALLRKFAEVWGVPVIAGTGNTSAHTLKNSGVNVRCPPVAGTACDTVP
jgi:hypothetical protein